ncbi:hypothetical protein OEZ86_006310 [Tetradesmus obliquus]|nr:hypothetical protein OEZ86_006310 [Tetradesmus obliquus]
MLPHSNGSEGSHQQQDPDDGEMHEAAAAAMGTDHGRGRRSRAGAGGRLRDLLQQEAKDLRTLEAEADQETEALAEASKAKRKTALQDDLSKQQQVEFMLGCDSCSFDQQAGCSACRIKPIAWRPMARWQPDAGRVQVELPEAPTFRPTAEEFADPFGYIMAVYDEIARQHGICKIIPPEGWTPPDAAALLQGLQFAAQRQFVSHLCMRAAPPVAAAAAAAAAAAGMEQQDAEGRHSQLPWDSASEQERLQLLLGQDSALLAQLDALAEAGPGAAASPAAGRDAAAGAAADASEQHPSIEQIEAELGSCLAVSGWRCEQQGLYSLQYMHSGAPQVWYAVPGQAGEAFEVAVADCLPQLAAADPLLLARQPVAVSPNELSARGLPVSRLVQEPGSFVLALPGAFTCSVATGFCAAEGLGLAPWDWLGHGCDAARKARLQGRRAAFSMEQLLVALVSAAKQVAAAHGLGGGEPEEEQQEHAEAVAAAAMAALQARLARQERRAARQAAAAAAAEAQAATAAAAAAAATEGVESADAAPADSAAEAAAAKPAAADGDPADPAAAAAAAEEEEAEAEEAKTPTAAAAAKAGKSPQAGSAKRSSKAAAKPAAAEEDLQQDAAAAAAGQAAAADGAVAAAAADDGQQLGTSEAAAAAGSGHQQLAAAAADDVPSDAEDSEDELLLGWLDGVAAGAAAAAGGRFDPRIDLESSNSELGSGSGEDDDEAAGQPAAAATAGAGADAAAEGENQQQQQGEAAASWCERWAAGVKQRSVAKSALMAAAGELVLRIEEEQGRQQAALLFGVGREQRMHGSPQLQDAAGCHTDTAGCVCELCQCDLWLSAVVSSEAPGRTVCPEHAAALAATPASCSLLFRHSIVELQRLVFEAAVLFPAVEGYIKAAQQRPRQRPWMRVKSLGPLDAEAGQGLAAPRCPELKPGGREPATPVAGG